MAGFYLYIIGYIFTLLTISCFVLDNTKRAAFLRRYRLPWTPQTFPPLKTRQEGAALPPGQEYKHTFPPSRRPALADLTGSRFSVGSTSEKGLAEQGHGSDKYKCLPDKQNVQASQYKHHSTPTGFTVEEIEALGNFPDHATLSGVPLPAAYTNFDIDTALPRPYRPFRWEYHQTMSYKKLEPDWWLELDKTYAQRIKQRQDLYAKHGSEILQALPGSEIACKELMEMCLQFLCARYPSYFSLDRQNLLFYNGILNTNTNLREVEPLEVLLNNVPEDFAIVLRNPESGYYSFRAGVVCSSIGWTVGSKIGKTLQEIHVPVPDYKEKMEFSMDRFFAKLPTDKPIQRGSWGLEIDTPLFMPPDSANLALRTSQSPSLSVSDINLRVDWQTLRRLPLSGAICFNFKCLFNPLSDFEDEKGIPGLVRKIMIDGKKSLLEYKGTWHVEHVALPKLEDMDKEQKKRRLIEEGWEPRTLDEYPYFEGWEEKWHRQQGF